VETGNHKDLVLLNLVEDSIRKSPHTRAPATTMYDRELQWLMRDRINGLLHCSRKAVAQF
jgi:hypothetical protein